MWSWGNAVYNNNSSVMMKPAFDEKVIQENCDQLINQSEKFI